MAEPIQPSNIAVAVATSALKAEQSRMRVIAENLANAESTASTPGGDPYRRQVPVFQPHAVAGKPGYLVGKVNFREVDVYLRAGNRRRNSGRRCGFPCCPVRLLLPLRQRDVAVVNYAP